MCGSKSNSLRPPSLSPNAEKLLKNGAALIQETGQTNHLIDQALCQKLGFDGIAELEQAVKDLKQHDRHPFFGVACWPGVDIRGDTLVLSPQVDDAWMEYEATLEYKKLTPEA